MKNWLPDEVIRRPKKGFGVPIAKWVKGPLNPLFRELLASDRVRREGFLNPEYVTRLLARSPCSIREIIENNYGPFSYGNSG